MKAVDGERVRRAIDAAQRDTTGRIGVRVTGEAVPDTLESAREHFHRAKLHEHPEANAVLFLVAPKIRQFAVFGGTAMHERLGPDFWVQLVSEMRPYFASGDPTGALVLGIDRVGAQLREHFSAEVTA